MGVQPIELAQNCGPAINMLLIGTMLRDESPYYGRTPPAHFHRNDRPKFMQVKMRSRKPRRSDWQTYCPRYPLAQSGNFRVRTQGD
jgi:hypothetical protein